MKTHAYGAALLLFCSVAAVRAASSDLTFASGERRCEVIAPLFQVVVDADADAWVTIHEAGAATPLAAVQSLWLTIAGRTYRPDRGMPPDLHTNRAGQYLTELHLQNIVLTDGASRWPGIAELSVFVHRDKVHIALDLICADRDWLVRTDRLTGRTRYVYEVREGHRAGPTVSPEGFGLDLACPADARPAGTNALLADRAAVMATVPDTGVGLQQTAQGLAIAASPGSVPWQPGSIHELGAVILVAASAPSRRDRLLVEQRPLPLQRLTVRNPAQGFGYDPRDGLWKIVGTSSSTPNPVPGQRGGAHLDVTNDAHPRTVLVEQRDNWGGIAGGMVLDGAGMPLPVPIQFELNFPEKRQHGESGFAALLYPLVLAAEERLAVEARHLFHGLAGRDLVYLNSLEPAAVNHAAILQVSVGREESHTARLGREFHLTDFRPHFRHRKGGSASASAITFLSYRDAAGSDQRLVGRQVCILESGPSVIAYAVAVASSDGCLDGQIRIWQPAAADATRIFSEVDLHVRRTISLDRSGEPALFFTRYQVGNPMVYRRFAYRNAAGETSVGDLPWGTGEAAVVVNGAAAGVPFFLSMFEASNYGGKHTDGTDLTISDRAGNPLLAVTAWDVRRGDATIAPGIFAYGSGPSEQRPRNVWYRRSVGVVPASPVADLPAGAAIRYRAVHVTGGDARSDAGMAEQELAAWGPGFAVLARHGTLVSDWPIHVRAENGRAELEIAGGLDWFPVRVSGLASGTLPEARVTQGGREERVGDDSPEDPACTLWPDGAGRVGATFLVRRTAVGPLRFHASDGRGR